LGATHDRLGVGDAQPAANFSQQLERPCYRIELAVSGRLGTLWQQMLKDDDACFFRWLTIAQRSVCAGDEPVSTHLQQFAGARPVA
jgi:hypothetical protein